MWQELYRLAYNYLTNLGLTFEEAEDLAQESLVAAYIHLDGVPQGKLKAWLFTVARRKYVDWLRRNKRNKRKYVLVDFIEELPDEAEGPDEALFAKEKKELILTILSRLSFHERNLLIMKYHLDFSYNEIAKCLNVKPETVKTGLYRARQKFKKEYQAIKGDSDDGRADT